MPRNSQVKKVKSAQRVLEVLEYFTQARQYATVMDITRAMGYPQSSTSELLGCLVSLGYLHTDRRARVYWPSARVALLGAWVNPALFRHGNLLPMMDWLATKAEASVALTSKVEIWSQYVHVVSHAAAAETPAMGARELLTCSPAGKLLLSTLDTDHARKLLGRINAEAAPEARVATEPLLAELKDLGVRKVAGGVSGDAGGVIAMLLPQTGSEPLAISLHCAREELTRRAGDYIRILKDAVQGTPDWRGDAGFVSPPPAANLAA